MPTLLSALKTSLLTLPLLLLISCASQLPYVPIVSPNYQIPANFKIVGYFPSWSGNPDEMQYRALTHICYAFADLRSSGEYGTIPNPDKLAKLVTQSHSAKVNILLSLGGATPTGEPNAFETVAADPNLTQVFIDNTLAVIAEYNLDGIDIDWEYPSARSAQTFAALVHLLAESLHAANKQLSIAVSADEVHGQDYLDSIINDVDFLNIMAYDDGFNQPPGIPHSSYRFARTALDYWVDIRHAPPSKAILGVPFYGRSLKDRHSISYYRLHKYNALSAAADASGDFSYNGFDTIRAKVVNQARVRGGGIMIWQLNQDANGSDSLLNAIFDAVKEPIEASPLN